LCFLGPGETEKLKKKSGATIPLILSVGLGLPL